MKQKGEGKGFHPPPPPPPDKGGGSKKKKMKMLFSPCLSFLNPSFSLALSRSFRIMGGRG